MHLAIIALLDTFPDELHGAAPAFLCLSFLYHIIIRFVLNLLEMAVVEGSLINGWWIFRNRLDACLLNSIKTVVLASEPVWTSVNHYHTVWDSWEV